jgi:2-polyprenyl-3-methyl-5-hydroxy-6-metoxy-1,4-benzoquinol methylase
MHLDKDVQSNNITIISNALAVSEYFDWLIDMFAHYLGDRVLEIGAGIGTISERIALHARTLVVSEIDTECFKIIKPKIESIQSSCIVEFAAYTLGEPCPKSFKQYPFDSVVITNVLEHVPDDGMALSHLRDIMKQHARLIIFVPAMEGIYCTLDKALGHYRRYSKQSLQNCLHNAGYNILEIKYVNFLGIFGWWLNGRVLRRKVVPESNFRYFKYLLPLVRVIESRVSLPFGISLLAIGEKQGGTP